MAKKKQHQKLRIFSPPFSPLTAVGILGTIALLITINVTSFQQYQENEQAQATRATRNLLTNVNLLNVLGSSTQTDNTTDNETQFKKKPEVMYWYDVLSKRPNYRDAYIILATLAYNDNRCQLATSFLSQAYLLDPNQPKDTLLAGAIEKCDNK